MRLTPTELEPVVGRAHPSHPDPFINKKGPEAAGARRTGRGIRSSRGRIRTFVDGFKVRCPAWLDDPGPSRHHFTGERPPTLAAPARLGVIAAGPGPSNFETPRPAL